MKSSLLIFCVAMAVLSGVSGNVVVEPKFQQILDNGNTQVKCTFDNPLEACQVRVWWDENSWVPLDLTESGSPVPVKTPAGVTLMRVKYAGAGFAKKQCGVQLSGVRYGNYLVQCRGRNKEGLWDQGYGLVASNTLPLLTSSTPTRRFVVSASGSNASVLLTNDNALTECDVKTPFEGELDLQVNMTIPPGSRYVTVGSGMENGQCGYALTNLSQLDAGVWWWMGKNGKVAVQMTVVAVAAAPVGQPVLTVQNPTKLRIGHPMLATCLMGQSSPLSKVTWLLDDVPLAPAPQDDMPDREDKFAWESQFTSQMLRRVMKAEDEGKVLKCRVTHVAMKNPSTSNPFVIHL